MRLHILKGLLILIGAGMLLTGCKTTYDSAASMDNSFPPAPPDRVNAPDSAPVYGK